MTIIPDSSFSFTAAVCAFLARSLSAAAILSFSLPPAPLPIFPNSPPALIFFHFLCSSSLSCFSKKPAAKRFYPRNLIEVIWLPINGADGGKTPGQRATVPIMLNTSWHYETSQQEGVEVWGGDGSWGSKHLTSIRTTCCQLHHNDVVTVVFWSSFPFCYLFFYCRSSPSTSNIWLKLQFYYLLVVKTVVVVPFYHFYFLFTFLLFYYYTIFISSSSIWY